MTDLTVMKDISLTASIAFQDNCQWPCFSGYKPLDRERRQIRILTLSPGHGAIQCSLEQVDLALAKPYYALSYVWGCGTNSKPVIIDGEEVLIRSSLWAFLRRLQEIKGRLRVWVDAICINQLDVAERDHQVGMMAGIFKHARGVFSWLGEAEEKQPRRAQKIWSLSYSSDRRRRKGPYGSSGCEVALYEIFSRPYWLRLWILQEVAIAKKVCFMDEHNQITFDELFHWLCRDRGLSKAEFLQESKRFHPDCYDLDHHPVLKPLPEIVNTPWSQRQQQRSRSRPGLQVFEALAQLRLSSHLSVPLPRLVRGFRHAGCQDPRDHIYGLLAIADANHTAQIIVDYSSPVLEVYLRNIDVWADERVGSHASDGVEKVYDGHQVVNSLTQFPPAFGPYCDIFDLQHLREDEESRLMVVSKLCIRCERIPGKPGYRTFACYSGSSRRIVPLTNDHKPMDTRPSVFISLVDGAFGVKGTRQDRVLYSTVELGSYDIFLKLQDSEITSKCSTLLLIARRAGHDLYIVGSGRLFEASAHMIRPDVWLSFQMLDAHFEINKLPSLTGISTTYCHSISDIKNPEYHVTFNGMAIAQMLEDNDYMAGFGSWNMFEFITQHQLTDIGREINLLLSPEPYHYNPGNLKDVDEVYVEVFDDSFNRYAPQLDNGDIGAESVVWRFG